LKICKGIFRTLTGPLKIVYSNQVRIQGVCLVVMAGAFLHQVLSIKDDKYQRP